MHRNLCPESQNHRLEQPAHLLAMLIWSFWLCLFHLACPQKMIALVCSFRGSKREALSGSGRRLITLFLDRVELTQQCLRPADGLPYRMVSTRIDLFLHRNSVVAIQVKQLVELKDSKLACRPLSEFLVVMPLTCVTAVQEVYAAFVTMAGLEIFRVLNSEYFDNIICSCGHRMSTPAATGEGPFYCGGYGCRPRGFGTLRRLYQHWAGTRCQSFSDLFFTCDECQRVVLWD